MTHQGRLSNRTLPVALALAVSGALAFAGPAMAQTPTAPAATAPAATAPAAPAPAPASHAATPPAAASAAAPAHRTASARVEQQITRLHTQLKITPQESQQWDAFAQVMRDNAQALDELYTQRSTQFADMTAVDGLKSYQQIEQAHADGLNKLVPAFQTLYAAMSPDQQKNADAVFRYQAERSQARARAKTPAPKKAGTPSNG